MGDIIEWTQKWMERTMFRQQTIDAGKMTFSQASLFISTQFMRKSMRHKIFMELNLIEFPNKKNSTLHNLLELN